MKRYLVYYDKNPINGIDGYDYVDALRSAKLKAPTAEYRKHLRIRLANKGLLKALAEQGNF